jgi:hypothetical protein
MRPVRCGTRENKGQEESRSAARKMSGSGERGKIYCDAPKYLIFSYSAFLRYVDNYLQQLLVLLLDVCAMHNYEVPPQPATTGLIVGTTYKGILQ